MKKNKYHVILTCDGGSGHKSAAEALRMKAITNGDESQVINTTRTGWFSGGGLNTSYKHDHLFYKGLIDLGPFATRWWDWAQRTSHTELLRAFASMRKLSSLSVPSFRHRTYNLLSNIKDIDNYSEVIFHNTQPNCLQALVFSIARYNREVKVHNLKNPKTPKNLVKLVNHLTDMPTLQAQMFIEEIANIDMADLDDAQFELRTRPPIVEHSDLAISSDDIELLYHQKLKKLYPKLYQDLLPGIERVKIVDGPIRKEFLQRKDNPAKRVDGLNIKFSNKGEFDVINKTLNNTLKEFNIETSCATMLLEEEVEIVSLMLGSQASIEGTIGLVQKEIEFSKKSSKLKNVFVFCGANKPEEGLILYQKVLAIAQEVNSSSNSYIKIIPLTNQPGSMIADTYSLADRVITRPGGISIMEIEAVVKRGKIFIFTELGKLPKLINKLLSRSPETLKRKYQKQKSSQRYVDLIAWEWGNALHAKNVCKDENGRTRVVPVNIYTFHNELAFLNKKNAVSEFISDHNYTAAFDILHGDPELNIFFLTGDGVGVELAYLVEINQLYTQISKDLSDLIEKNEALKTLDNGPNTTLALINEARNSILLKLFQKDIPSNILKDIPKQIKEITVSLENSINVVKQSNICNKSVIVRTLEFLSLTITNFFRSIFGLKLNFKPESALENLNKKIKTVIDRPSIIKFHQPDDNTVGDLQWDELDKIIKTFPKEDKNIRIKQSDYPQLTQDFLFSGSREGEPVCYAIGKVLGQGGGGIVSSLKNRFGKPAVMKEHTLKTDNKLNDFKSELKCLEKMDMLIDDRHLPKGNISLQKYIPGQRLKDFIIPSAPYQFFTLVKPAIEEKKIKLAVALATALKNVLDKGITHGDITPDNVLIQEDKDNQITATFIDFGLSQIEQYPKLTLIPIVSRYYRAPELIKASDSHQEGASQVYPYSDKSDIYALGILLKDLGLKQPLIKKMIDKEPTKRPNINEVLVALSVNLSPKETMKSNASFQISIGN